MKTIENKSFKIKMSQMYQEGATGTLKEITVKSETKFLTFIQGQINQAPEGGYKDLSLLRNRLRVLDIIEENIDENSIEVEDADFETIIKAGEDLIPAITSRGMLDFKDYIQELRESSKEDKKKKNNKK